MRSSIYTSASGMLAQEKQHELITDNLASWTVPGHKKSIPLYRSFNAVLETMRQQPFEEPLANPVELHDVHIDFSDGPVKTTGAPLDIALQGQGFLVVQSPYGERYTRNGAMAINTQGFLSTKAGYPIMGQAGTVSIDPQTKDIQITREGDIYADGLLLDRLNVVTFQDLQSLQAEGASLFHNTNRQQNPKSSTAAVLQKHLEGSNVEPVLAMTHMMLAQKHYDISAKVLKAQDQSMGTLLQILS